MGLTYFVSYLDFRWFCELCPVGQELSCSCLLLLLDPTCSVSFPLPLPLPLPILSPSCFYRVPFEAHRVPRICFLSCSYLQKVLRGSKPYSRSSRPRLQSCLLGSDYLLLTTPSWGSSSLWLKDEMEPSPLTLHLRPGSFPQLFSGFLFPLKQYKLQLRPGIHSQRTGLRGDRVDSQTTRKDLSFQWPEAHATSKVEGKTSYSIIKFKQIDKNCCGLFYRVLRNI